MLLSVIVLALLALALTAVTRSCSFSPAGPSTSGAATVTVNVPDEFRSDAATVGFPLRQPAVPEGWHANSAAVSSVPGGAGGQDTAMRLGLVTPDGHYVEVVQSNADAADLVRFVDGLPAGTTVAARGTVDAAGTTWTSYPGVRDEVAWETEIGSGTDSVRALITGDGTPAECQALASAIRSAPIVPAK